MDYEKLAIEFMEKMHLLKKARPHRQINESMHGESFMLHYLSFQGNSALPSEISNIMGISSARIAAALNSLERKGLITRRIDPSDRRRILVDLTSEGKALAEERHRTMLEETTTLLSMLGEQDAREYVRITGKLAEAIAKCKERK
ncbi:MarR family winged helix-turn-helix transcriptional regulator [Clostridium aminobutyricum]|uniref:MarR family transcriptional regulator n=1 Tax=Clostridium aminobutyricum TaxID=33953 RepID=A0A939D9E1_CLOAM|nr:MarR family transcriptional regulator [Clostridium aminobutyricum]MBN7773626.1 MarR family transcriptional regulator [Clostridium aminobutyricum]